MTLSCGELEAKIAASIRAYHSARERHDVADEEEQLRRICSGLGRLLGRLLQGQQRWRRWQWMDDILPWSADTVSPTELELRGLAIWGESGTTSQWWEPVAASVRISPGADEVLAFRLRFADAACGLGQVPYATCPRRADWRSPRAWLFSFSEADRPP